MKRQGMEVSIKELREKADELEKELCEVEQLSGEERLTQKCQVVIINEHETSDTWRFED